MTLQDMANSVTHARQFKVSRVAAPFVKPSALVPLAQEQIMSAYDWRRELILRKMRTELEERAASLAESVAKNCEFGDTVEVRLASEPSPLLVERVEQILCALHAGFWLVESKGWLLIIKRRRNPIFAY